MAVSFFKRPASGEIALGRRSSAPTAPEFALVEFQNPGQHGNDVHRTEARPVTGGDQIGHLLGNEPGTNLIIVDVLERYRLQISQRFQGVIQGQALDVSLAREARGVAPFASGTMRAAGEVDRLRGFAVPMPRRPSLLIMTVAEPLWNGSRRRHHRIGDAASTAPCPGKNLVVVEAQ